MGKIGVCAAAKARLILPPDKSRRFLPFHLSLLFLFIFVIFSPFLSPNFTHPPRLLYLTIINLDGISSGVFFGNGDRSAPEEKERSFFFFFCSIFFFFRDAVNQTSSIWEETFLIFFLFLVFFFLLLSYSCRLGEVLANGVKRLGGSCCCPDVKVSRRSNFEVQNHIESLRLQLMGYAPPPPPSFIQ